MSKKLIYLVLLLAFYLASWVHAANIIWIAGIHDDNGDGSPDDQAWVDLLEAQGHTVDFQRGIWEQLDDSKIAALNDADLVIVSRCSYSSSYDDGDEVAQWNSITTAIINSSTLLTRSSRWRWLDTTTLPNFSDTVVDIVAADHPIFAGVTSPVQITDGAVGLSTFADISGVGAGNGTLLARVTDTEAAWIVEWEAGVEFYPGSGQVAGGPRIFFAAGTLESGGAIGRGEYNLTPEGEQVFLNAVRYFLGDLKRVKAYAPVPADDVFYEDTWVRFGWRVGDTAVSHDVYFGDNFDDVNTGTGDTFRGNQTATIFAAGFPGFPYPDGLVPSTTYYWRIDEVEADGTTVHKGDVWSFTVSPIGPVEDFEGNNFSTFPWEHHGDASWTITSYEKHSRTYSAQAGAIDHDERTTLQVLLDCTSGDITFYRKVSSEPGCDYLEFYIDGVRKGRWSGTMDWEQVSFPVRAGTRTFDWTYSKNGSVSSDWDTAWVDDIVFPIGSDTIPTGEVIELTDATFDQIVLSSDVPVLIDFWAPWCGPCLVMAPVIEEIADEYAGKVKVCRLNVDNEPQTTMNYGIRFIPTFILFKDGQVQRQWVGVTSKEELTAAIDELL
jgi:thioredoxin